MSLRRIIAIRVAMGVAVAWAVLTLVFALFTMTDDWVLNIQLAQLRFAGAPEEVLEAVREQYLMQRGLDRPLWQVYLDWMANMVTFDWGDSFVTGEPARSVVAGGVTRTAMYVVPSLAIAISLAVGIGLYAALYRDDPLPRYLVAAVYVAFVVPMFWIGGLALSYGYADWVYDHLLPIALTTAALLGGYVSYARAHSLEYAGRDFTKLVRAKGASNVQVARHVLRNAAIPFFSMLFTEMLLLLLLAVFVLETVLGINGFGLVVLEATRERDLPVLMAATIVVIFIGVAGNIIQDISYSYFDPRVDTGSR